MKGTNPRKEINKAIQERLAQGETKANIFKYLRGQFEDDNLSARLLALWPDLELRQKYRNLNRVLLAILVLITITKVLFAGLFILSEIPFALPLLILVPLINIYLIWLVAKFNGLGYILMVPLGLGGLCKMLDELPNEPMLVDIITTSVLSVLILAAMVLAVILYRRLLPNTTLLMQPKKDEAEQYIF